MRNNKKSEWQKKSIPASTPFFGSSSDLMNFRNRLKEAIGDEPVRTFGGRCGPSKGLLYNYLNGAPYPTLDRVQVIANAANKHISFFISICQQSGKSVHAEIINNGFILTPHHSVPPETNDMGEPLVDNQVPNRA